MAFFRPIFAQYDDPFTSNGYSPKQGVLESFFDNFRGIREDMVVFFGTLQEGGEHLLLWLKSFVISLFTAIDAHQFFSFGEKIIASFLAAAEKIMEIGPR